MAIKSKSAKARGGATGGESKLKKSKPMKAVVMQKPNPKTKPKKDKVARAKALRVPKVKVEVPPPMPPPISLATDVVAPPMPEPVVTLDSEEDSGDDDKKAAEGKPTRIARCSDCEKRCEACFRARKDNRKRAREEAGTSQGDSPALQQWRTYYKTWCEEHVELCEGKQMSERAKIAGVFYRHANKNTREGDEELQKLYGILK